MLFDCARDIHLAAARATRPEPVQFARDLFARAMADEYDTFDGAAARYADVLGEAGLAEYRHLAAEAWDRLPSRGGGRGRQEGSDDYRRLASILDFFVERNGDVDARIGLRAKDLSSPWSYLQLAEFCLSHGRKEEALRRAEEGLWVFEDGQPDERLVFFTAELLSTLGRNDDAAAHLWRAFEKAPSLELYARLRKISGGAAHDRALMFLADRLSAKDVARRHHPADLLVRIQTNEKTFGAAWAVVRKHGAPRGSKENLARMSEATHPCKALEIYAERVDQFAEGGGNRAYAEAAELVTRMAALRGAVDQAAYCRRVEGTLRPQAQLHEAIGVTPCVVPQSRSRTGISWSASASSAWRRTS